MRRGRLCWRLRMGVEGQAIGRGELEVPHSRLSKTAKSDRPRVHLAKILGVNQAAVSKLERRAYMYVSTLQSFVKAMGGELKITARFPERTVEINQFEDVKKVAPEE
jgi:hypothetical protein